MAFMPLLLVLLFVGAVGFAAATVVSQAHFFAYSDGFSYIEEVSQKAMGEALQDAPQKGEEKTIEKDSDDSTSEDPLDGRSFDYDSVEHIETPEAVKALYITSCAIGTPSLRNHVFSIVDSTEINAVVIDVKDYSGTLSFRPRNSELEHLYENANCGSPYMGEIISDLHEKGVYVIGRITVFQDPYYANLHPDVAVARASDGSIWEDFKGLNFTDPGSKQVWKHHVAIAKEAYEIGFDELNFDYIRYPSDGPMSDIAFPHTGERAKADVLEEFFEYLDTELEKEVPGAVTSADLFGMTTTASNDLNIGQILERAFPYFDYIAPMVYPSHYPPGFEGYADPNTVPYEIVKLAMESGIEKAKEAGYDWTKLRSWIQDFDYGGTYDTEAVRAQIQATYDAGLDSWMVWDPANRYTADAFEAE